MKPMNRFSVPVLLLVLAAVALVSTGCSRRPPDNQLAANVQSKLGSDPALQGQPIAVAVKDGTVTLTGTVNGQGSRELAANDAAAVKGVKKVVNDLGLPGAPGPVPAGPEAGGNAAPPNQPGPPPPPAANPGTSNIAPPPPPPAAAPAPEPSQPIVIPAGTRIQVRLGQSISTKTSQTGDPFSGTLSNSVRVNGQTIIRAGAQARGVVSESKSPGRFKGQGVLALRLDSLRSDGRTYQVQTSSLERVQKGKGKRTAVMTGGGAGLGAIIGGVAGGGKGALIGGLVGGGAGVAGSGLTGNHNIELPAETVLTFNLTRSVTISR